MKTPAKPSPLSVLLVLLCALGWVGCIDTPDIDGPDTSHSDVVDDDAGDVTDAPEADTPDAPTRDIGAPCQHPTDCPTGAACIGTKDGGFVCMKECTDLGRICEDGSVCSTRVSGANPICYIGGDTPRGEPCQNNLDCEPGTLCFGPTDGDARYCLAACHEQDPVCDDGYHCRTTGSGKGYCRADLGARCTTSADCAEELSCSAELGGSVSGQFPGGYCTSECATDADCSGGVCRTLPGTETSICLQSCDVNADCRFNETYNCLRSEACQGQDCLYVSCDETTDPQACRTFLSEDGVCVYAATTTSF